MRKLMRHPGERGTRFLMVRSRMPKVKLLVENGIAMPDAVKAALGMTIRDFAEAHSIPETCVSGVINGSTPHPYERVRDALAAALEVDREWLDAHLPRKAVA